ncbi:MAG: TRL-like family protein [Planctomycetota bacterium]
MRAVFTCVLAVSVLVSVSGCYLAPVIPPTGLIFSDIKAPISIGGSNKELGSKMGSGYSESILGAVSWGDCSIASAAKKAGITRIHHVGYEYFNVIGAYQKFTVVVYGD